jgi:hypothetical protein
MIEEKMRGFKVDYAIGNGPRRHTTLTTLDSSPTLLTEVMSRQLYAYRYYYWPLSTGGTVARWAVAG